MSYTKIEYIYPPLGERKKFIERARTILSYVIIAAAYACPIINICVGGKAWSVVVLWGLLSLWTVCLNRPLVEFNRISKTANALLYAAVMMVLIEIFLVSGWAELVMPIVCFGMLIIMGVLFFSDLRRQTQNIMPMLWAAAGSLVAFICAWIVMPKLTWPVIVMGAVAAALFIASGIALKGGLLLELKKRFHM